jgi:hypothetical protein
MIEAAPLEVRSLLKIALKLIRFRTWMKLLKLRNVADGEKP